MAPDFTFLNLKKDSHNGHYNAEIEFEGRKGRYEIYTNVKFYFYDWLDNSINILDGADRAFDGESREDLGLCIKALDFKGLRYERELRKEILNFIGNECSEN